jgi:transglutaminase superfamily protein
MVTVELIRPRRLPPGAKALLGLEIAVTYLQVRAALRRRDFRAVVADLRVADTPAQRHPELAAARLADVVRRTLASAPPRSRCLVQSLVLTRLLARRGIESSLVIAVSPGRRFAAHAWVESAGIELLPRADAPFRTLVRL